jgi:hypothetical protein
VDRAPWTYEVPPAGSDAVGLEDYEVETADGQRIGKVKVVLRRGEDVLLVVEGGVPPALRDVRAVQWTDVVDVDHDALTVRVKQGALDRAVRLDPEQAIEGDAADATRVTAVPGESGTPPRPASRGPVDRPSYLVALFLGLMGVFGALVLITLGTAADLGWLWALVALPALLFLLSGVFAYRFFRRPSERL